MKTTTIPVKGMHCASCAVVIKNSLTKLEGVKNCDVNIATEKANIEYDPQKVSIETMSKKIEPYGYTLVNDENHLEHADHVMHNEHAEHTGQNQTKIQKENELAELKEKINFALPVSLFTFFAMTWEILSKSFNGIPAFFIPMPVFNAFLFILSTVVLFWIGKVFIIGVVRFAKHRVANMDTLIGIGTLTAYIYSSIIVLFPQIANILKLPETTYFDVTIVVIGFITLGKYLEAKSKLKTGEAIEKLLNLQAKTAFVEREEKVMEIAINQVLLGDIIIVKPGSKIPVDGEIVEGNSSVDESMISGEPIPVDKKIGDLLTGGTLNKQGVLKFKATKIGSETLLSQIIKMVESAQGSRAPIQKLADEVSSVFVPVVLIISIVTLISWLTIAPLYMDFSGALSLGLISFVGILVIACPCALGLATPTAIIVGVGKGANSGILIKNAESLEKLYKVNALVVDKTGTITKGSPEVTDVIKTSNLNEKEILSVLGSLENNSEHPLATAILEKVKISKIKIEDVTHFEIIEGKGLKAKIKNTEYFAGNLKLIKDLDLKIDTKIIEKLTKQGKTPVLLTSKSEILGIIAISDTIKETAIDIVKNLHNLGIKVVMLTGDNKNTAEYIAKIVGIDEVFAEVLPAEKADKIKELQKAGLFVAMAGDGVNDAPALAQANVGIAMGTGTDVAIESADITLLHGDISKIAKAIKLSKFTMQTIKQNLFFAFIYNVVGIPVAAGILYPFFGITLSPVFAGMAMAFSSISVVSNSLRLKTSKI